MEKMPDPPSVAVFGYGIDQLLEYGMKCKLEERERIKKIIRDDSLASQYDTFPKYRTALLRAISRN